jgi:hypothetical protein
MLKTEPYPRLPIMMPATTSATPRALGIVTPSLKKIALKIKTKTKAKLIKGQA